MEATIAEKVALNLLKINAIELRPNHPFTWASGILSPIYCDNRLSLSYPAVRNVVKESLVAKAATFGNIDVVAGVATAGIPHGVLLADALQLPFVYIREKPKGHGRQNQIEGKIEAGQSVLVVEDLISTGGSALAAIEALDAQNIDIVGLLAIFTYGFEEANRKFEERKLRCKTLSNYDILLKVASENGFIQLQDLDVLKKWRLDPKNWTGTNLT